MEKAKSIALRYENYTLLLEIIRWEKIIITTSSIYENTEEKDIVQLSLEEKSTSYKIENANEYWKIYVTTYFNLIRYGSARRLKDIDKYDNIFNKLDLKNKDLAISFQAKRY